MPDAEDRIRDYLRSRADVEVPGDLRWPSAADGARRSKNHRWRTWIALAAAAAVAVVVVGASLGFRLPGVAGPGSSARAPGDGEVPTSVAGMPVLSVEAAFDLLQRGDLDGRAVAVAGWFGQFQPSCPAPNGYVATLEDWCSFVAYTDTEAGARLCAPMGDGGVTCHGVQGIALSPSFMAETSGRLPSVGGFMNDPIHLVVIGHAGDARQLHCPADKQGECARSFVLDRVAWMHGQDVPLMAPESYDRSGYHRLSPRMSLEQATAAAGAAPAIAAAAFQAGDINTIDPRWNLDGDDIVWLVRSVHPGGSGADTSRAVAVTLVDDATGKVIDAHDLALGGDFRPARLWTIATTKGVDCCAGNSFPFVRVAAVGGVTLHEGVVEGGSSGTELDTTFGPGAPLVVGPGSYAVDLWLATIDTGVTGPGMDTCSTEITLEAGEDKMLEAVFPAPGKSCVFGPPTAPKLTRF